MRVIINNSLYDITTFIPEHPGGPTVFGSNDNDSDNNDNNDITEKFNEVGHSEYAVNLLGNYKVADISDDDPRFRPSCKIEYNKTKISKLVTHEDKFHIHKFMGTISILNYFYLFFDCFYSGAAANMTLRPVDTGFIALTWVHTALSLSALQFLIPRTRTGILPMIWQEFRAHSIIFAVRSFIIVNVIYFCNLHATAVDNHNHNPGLHIVANIVIRCMAVFVAMKLADISTRFLRENRKETTTATMPYWSGCPPRVQAAVKYFYTHSQFMATTACLFSNVPYILAVAFPIQIASFLMTLVRKQIISAFWYHALYGSSLMVVYLINVADPALYPISLIGVMMMYIRIQLKFNKYALWIVTAVTGGWIQYALSSAAYHEKVRIFTSTGIFVAIPLIAIFAYHFTVANLSRSYDVTFRIQPTTVFGAWIMAVLFEEPNHKREESNHRVKRNAPIRSESGSHNKITIQLCETYPNYRPGMYFNLYFDTAKRPYTPVDMNADADADSDTNTGDKATFLVKRVDNGEVSPMICDKYIENQTVFVKGPFGRKYYDPGNHGFMCDGQQVTAKIVIMFSCGSGITPFYSMGSAWIKNENRPEQELHYMSSYRTRDDAILRVTGTGIQEKLFISSENSKLAPMGIIDYFASLVNPVTTTRETIIRPRDIAVFICGTRQYSQMVKDSCSIYSDDIKCYEW
jgi:ferredoxin-NADP reductase